MFPRAAGVRKQILVDLILQLQEYLFHDRKLKFLLAYSLSTWSSRTAIASALMVFFRYECAMVLKKAARYFGRQLYGLAKYGLKITVRPRNYESTHDTCRGSACWRTTPSYHEATGSESSRARARDSADRPEGKPQDIWAMRQRRFNMIARRRCANAGPLNPPV